MKKVAVRCWEIKNYHTDREPDTLFITYPEGHMGYSLLTCLTCGAIYAVDVSAELYIAPLDEKLKEVRCTHCNNFLSNNYAYYPETYVKNGKIYHFKREMVIPPDEESVIKEFEAIY